MKLVKIVVLREATQEDLKQFRPAGSGGRMRHKPGHQGWHWMHTLYELHVGRRKKRLIVCEEHDPWIGLLHD